MLIIKDLSSTMELDRKALANVTGGRYRSRRPYYGPIPFNKDPETGGEMAKRWQEAYGVIRFNFF